jgi:hypothetical protein
MEIKTAKLMLLSVAEEISQSAENDRNRCSLVGLVYFYDARWWGRGENGQQMFLTQIIS